jgi:hypothetical protein
MISSGPTGDHDLGRSLPACPHRRENLPLILALQIAGEAASALD